MNDADIGNGGSSNNGIPCPIVCTPIISELSTHDMFTVEFGPPELPL